MRLGQAEKDSTTSLEAMAVQARTRKPMCGVGRVDKGTIQRRLMVVAKRSHLRSQRVGERLVVWKSEGAC